MNHRGDIKSSIYLIYRTLCYNSTSNLMVVKLRQTLWPVLINPEGHFRYLLSLKWIIFIDYFKYATTIHLDIPSPICYHRPFTVFIGHTKKHSRWCKFFEHSKEILGCHYHQVDHPFSSSPPMSSLSSSSSLFWIFHISAYFPPSSTNS